LRLGSVTARHSSGGHQPNFAALNRERHLYSAGRPSHWALAHILVFQDLVKFKIGKLREDKASADDKEGVVLSTTEIVDEIAEPLTEIFNKSISEGIVPQDWKVLVANSLLPF